MSYDEIIYKNDIFPSIEMNHIYPKDESMTDNEIFDLCNSNIRDSYEGKKKVRFPEESEIVSDYFEAKNYWQEQRFCSCEELMSSYKKACEEYNIRPIPILLEQIKGIDVALCNERYDMLNLSNIKLDLKHVESMEEIFKRVQFKTLNFENTTLDDESAASLFEIIEYYESCLKLNLSQNGKISYAGFNACSKMLKKTPCLDTIELKGIIFTDTTIPPLNRALRCGSNLKVLHLENSNICSKNLLILSSALKLNIHLKELHLSGNRMVPSDGIQLGSLLKVNKLLETLDVRNNSLGDVGLSHICDGLAAQFQTHNNRSDSDIQGHGLLCLILWSNSITYNGMASMSDALKATKSLQSLNLGNNPISSEGIHILREGLLSNRTLIRLSLPCCRITCEGGVALAEYLADTKQLMRLDIRDNDIKTAGLMAVSLSMRVNKSLTRLDVDPNPKKDANVKGFFETQTESLKIIQQRIQENKRVTMEKHDMELSQSFISLSNQPQDTLEVVSDPSSNLPDLDVSIPLSHTEPDEVFQTVNDTESLYFTSAEVPKVPTTLDLSPDSDVSLAYMDNFANRVLSPTDNLLNNDNQSESTIVMECDISPSEAASIVSNFVTEESSPDNDIILINNIDGTVDNKIITNNNYIDEGKLCSESDLSLFETIPVTIGETHLSASPCSIVEDGRIQENDEIPHDIVPNKDDTDDDPSKEHGIDCSNTTEFLAIDNISSHEPLTEDLTVSDAPEL